jgi:hypothetical protein
MPPKMQLEDGELGYMPARGPASILPRFKYENDIGCWRLRGLGGEASYYGSDGNYHTHNLAYEDRGRIALADQYEPGGFDSGWRYTGPGESLYFFFSEIPFEPEDDPGKTCYRMYFSEDRRGFRRLYTYSGTTRSDL